MIQRSSAAALVAAACVFGAASVVASTPAAKPADKPQISSTAKAPTPNGCFAAGDGYLRARLRGALSLDLNWHDAQMQCDGGPRPSGNGVRVSIGGPLRADGRRIRMVFGIAGVAEGRGGDSLRTNVTILFEGEKRIFATQGDDKCTVDSLTQQRVETLGTGRAIYRVEARGFCLGPATSLSREERVFLTSFDFAGRVEFSDDDRHETPPIKP
jgi:hypothetical protein